MSFLGIGLAVNGFGNEALDLFEYLKREQLGPIEISFLGF